MVESDPLSSPGMVEGEVGFPALPSQAETVIATPLSMASADCTVNSPPPEVFRLVHQRFPPTPGQVLVGVFLCRQNWHRNVGLQEGCRRWERLDAVRGLLDQLRTTKGFTLIVKRVPS